MNAWSQIEIGTAVINPAIVLDALKSQHPVPAGDRAAKQEVEFLLRGLGTVMNYAKSSMIFKEGGNAKALYQVMSGAVALWHRAPNGKRQIVDFRLPGEFFGVVYRPTETLNAEASSDCVVTAYRRGAVDEMCDSVPSFRRSIAQLTAEPVISRSEAIRIEARTTKERMADFLLRAAERAAESGEIVLPFSGRDIGDRIDAPQELVANGLSELETMGAIARTGEGGLVVINPATLRAQIQ
jgi:CRP/FNR family nitrogen fixation transcriptional regulator